jgi:hypothetical protein
MLESRLQDSVDSLEISKDEESGVPAPPTAAMQQVCPDCHRGRLLPRTGLNCSFMVCERKDRGFFKLAPVAEGATADISATR